MNRPTAEMAVLEKHALKAGEEAGTSKRDSLVQDVCKAKEGRKE